MTKKTSLALAAALFAVASCGGGNEAATTTRARDSTTTTREVTTTTETATTTTRKPTTTTTTTTEPVGPLPATTQLYGTRNDVPAGTPGKLEVVAHGQISDVQTLAVVVRNNTSAEVARVEVSAAARDAAGNLVGSGKSADVAPAIVKPGGVVIGYVFFNPAPEPGGTFEFSVSSERADEGSSVDLTVTEANVAGPNVVGVVENTSGVDVEYASALSLCFDQTGTPTYAHDDYTNPSDLAPGQTGSFSTSLFGAACDTFLTGATGSDFDF